MGLKFIIFAVLVTAAQFSSTLAFVSGGRGGSQGCAAKPKIEAQRQAAYAADRRGMSLLYDAYKQKLANPANPILPPDGEKKVYQAFKDEIDAIYKAIILAQPSAAGTVAKTRQKTYNALMTLIKGIAVGIQLADASCVEAGKKIQKHENVTVEDGSTMLRDVYVSILNCRNPSTPDGAEIEQDEALTVAVGVKVSTGIYDGLKFVLARICPKLCFPGLKGATLKSLEQRNVDVIFAMVDGFFKGIYDTCDAKYTH